VSRDGAGLWAEAHGRTLASIDTTSFEVTEPAKRTEAAQGRSKVAGLLLLVATAAALAAAAVARLMRRPVSTSKT
jgi:hypothetical protein